MKTFWNIHQHKCILCRNLSDVTCLDLPWHWLESAPSAGYQSYFFVVVWGIEYKMWKSLGLHVQVHFNCAWQLARQIQINLHEHVHDPFHIVWVALHSNQELLSRINSHTESFGTFGDFSGSGKMMNNFVRSSSFNRSGTRSPWLIGGIRGDGTQMVMSVNASCLPVLGSYQVHLSSGWGSATIYPYNRSPRKQYSSILIWTTTVYT